MNTKEKYSSRLFLILTVVLMGFMTACKSESKKQQSFEKEKNGLKQSATSRKQNKAVSHENMAFIEGGVYAMGASDKYGRADEYPPHQVEVDDFWMDKHPVTNADFRKFVEATGYVTVAEQKPDWEEMKKQLPPGTPKPPDSILIPGGLVFLPPDHPVSLRDESQWWAWMPGTDWQHPQGPESSIEGKDDYPVVQVSWEDAMAYADWAGKRLPTEAEWEYAARGGLKDKIYSWGDEDPEEGDPKANTWQGHFPNKNTGDDGFMALAPVKSFAPNGYELYDMAGNVWEWVHDWYDANYYKELAGTLTSNPTGPKGEELPMPMPMRVVRGGSFMCHSSYCKGYRVSSRMMSSPDTGLENVGFRLVSTQ